MDLVSQKEVKNLLRKYQIRPSKGLGQNFLVSQAALKKIIEAADLQPEDTILEIGPGIGTLTQELAKRAKRVVAVEKDAKMIDILKETLKGFKNVEISRGDIRNLKLEIRNYKVVANLPYYITSPVIRKFLETGEARPPLSMVLMIQKEVAQRICAKPPDMSLLAVAVQFYAKPEIISYVSKSSFWPQPKVDSAIIKVVPTSDVGTTFATLIPVFFKLVRTGFSHPRKQLINNLSTGLNTKRPIVQNWLSENNINPNQRAETLSMEDWLKLTKSSKIE